jgi:hypothetical protein
MTKSFSLDFYSFRIVCYCWFCIVLKGFSNFVAIKVKSFLVSSPLMLNLSGDDCHHACHITKMK